MKQRDQFQVDLMKREEHELRMQRRFLHVILGHEADREPADASLLVAGLACLFIEAGLAFYFFSRILNWDVLISSLLAAGLVAVLSLGPKHWIDQYYANAQRAADQARLDVTDPAKAGNLVAMDSAEDARQAARGKYADVRLMITALSCAAIVTGVVLLAVERVRLEIGSDDSLSWLAYGYNTLLLLGAGLMSATVFHYYNRRNEEVRQLNAFDGQIRKRQQHIIHLLQSGENNDDNAGPQQPDKSEGMAAGSEEQPLRPVGANGNGGGPRVWDYRRRN